MTRALRRQDDGLETPIIDRALYADTFVALARNGRGIIDSLSPEELRALGALPDGPTDEVGQNPKK